MYILVYKAINVTNLIQVVDLPACMMEVCHQVADQAC